MIILFKDYPVFPKKKIHPSYFKNQKPNFYLEGKKKKSSFKQIFPEKKTTIIYLGGGEERDRKGKEK